MTNHTSEVLYPNKCTCRNESPSAAYMHVQQVSFPSAMIMLWRLPKCHLENVLLLKIAFHYCCFFLPLS